MTLNQRCQKKTDKTNPQITEDTGTPWKQPRTYSQRHTCLCNQLKTCVLYYLFVWLYWMLLVVTFPCPVSPFPLRLSYPLPLPPSPPPLPLPSPDSRNFHENWLIKINRDRNCVTIIETVMYGLHLFGVFWLQNLHVLQSIWKDGFTVYTVVPVVKDTIWISHWL